VLQRFTKTGAISNHIWHDQAYKKRNVAISRKKKVYEQLTAKKARRQRNMNLFRSTAREIGSKVAMEQQLGTVATRWCDMCMYDLLLCAPLVRHRPAAKLYVETDEEALFEDDWAQMRLPSLAKSTDDTEGIKEVLHDNYSAFRELFVVTVLCMCAHPSQCYSLPRGSHCMRACVCTCVRACVRACVCAVAGSGCTATL